MRSCGKGDGSPAHKQPRLPERLLSPLRSGSEPGMAPLKLTTFDNLKPQTSARAPIHGRLARRSRNAHPRHLATRHRFGSPSAPTPIVPPSLRSAGPYFMLILTANLAVGMGIAAPHASGGTSDVPSISVPSISVPARVGSAPGRGSNPRLPATAEFLGYNTLPVPFAIR